MQEAATWHYFVAMFLLALLGVAGHVLRAVVNVVPDRLTSRRMVDLVISDGYDWKDMLFGTEYDEAGYYRLDSVRNLRITTWWTVFCGMSVMIFSDGASIIIASLIDSGLVYLRELFSYRLDNFRWV